MTSARRPAFTLIDLLVVLGLVVVLLAILLPTARRVRDYAWPIKCGSNLREIGQAMFEYANANRGAYPRTRYDPAQSTPVAYTGVNAAQPFAADGPKPNDVTAILYLLVREQGVDPATFICPGTSRDPFDFGGVGGKASSFSNFPSEKHLSYSVHNAYPAAGSGVSPETWSNRLKADFAIAADMNPGSRALLQVTPSSSVNDLRKANTRNHPQRGQSVLYGDGHVDIYPSPFMGYNQDNVYTYGPPMPSSGPWVAPLSSGIVGPPAHANDSVLLPVATSDPGTIEPSETSRKITSFLESGWIARITLLGVAAGFFFLWRILKDARAAKRRS